MRFLADENFPKAAVTALREAGLTVDWAIEFGPGATDRAVLVRAREVGAVILTFDKDFGELARTTPTPVGFGVVGALFLVPKDRRPPSQYACTVLSPEPPCGWLCA